MRAIWINAKDHKITEVDFDGSLKQMQLHVGGYIETALNLGDGDVLYVDEEGLLKQLHHGFLFGGAGHRFVGSGFICGVRGGECAPAKISVATIEQNVRFICLR